MDAIVSMSSTLMEAKLNDDCAGCCWKFLDRINRIDRIEKGAAR